MQQSVRIGTRGSQLALYQAELVKARLTSIFPMAEIQIVVIKTSGDMIRRGGNAPFETKRIFTREIEDALLANQVDLAVHSAKDMSVDMPQGLQLTAALEREDPSDCLISKDKLTMGQLPPGARIGTSSIRRKVQLLRWNENLIIEEVRGNVDTRIRKMEEGLYDAILLAHAGVKRLGLGHYVAEVLPTDSFYPSPGQGIIAVQSRAEDADVNEMIATLNCSSSWRQLECERAFLRRLEGGCQLPCGITTVLKDQTIKLAGALFAIETRDWVETTHEAPAEQAAQAGADLAQKILDQGGKEILEKIRGLGGKFQN